jgi:hypothetical protein
MAEPSLVIALIALASSALHGMFTILKSIKRSKCCCGGECVTRDPDENEKPIDINGDLVQLVRDLSMDSAEERREKHMRDRSESAPAHIEANGPRPLPVLPPKLEKKKQNVKTIRSPLSRSGRSLSSRASRHSRRSRSMHEEQEHSFSSSCSDKTIKASSMSEAQESLSSSSNVRTFRTVDGLPPKCLYYRSFYGMVP